MKAFLLVLTCLALASCQTAPRTVPVPTKVPVAVRCKAVVPERPVMPTESIVLDPTSADFLDRFVAVTTAEIEVYRGYAGRLLAELKSCL